MLTELNPKPDCVTITTGTTLWDVTQAFIPGDADGTHLADPKVAAAWADMVVDSTSSFYVEHLKRLSQEQDPALLRAGVTSISSRSSSGCCAPASTRDRSTWRCAVTAAARWAAIRSTGWKCCAVRRTVRPA